MALLVFRDIAKSYGIVPVLKGIDLVVKPGEVLALVGENGAGKSTLMRIAAGLAPPSSGTMLLDGAPAPATLHAAERAGIVMVHQEFCLAPHLTVAENVFLGREITRGLFTDRKAMEIRARDLLAELGSVAPVRARLRDLPVSDWQMIELAKAFARQPKLILMDEPTAVLSATEAGNLFARIRAFRETGGSVIFTSHRLDEVKNIADRVAVLRDGQIVRVANTSDISEDAMAEAMVGRPLAEIYPPRRGAADRKALLSVAGLTSPGAVEEATLDIREGEVLGISGLVGSGRTELFEALFGLRPARCGSFVLKLAYLTEDRKGKGLLLGKSLDQNVALTKGAINGASWIDRRAERRDLEAAVGRYDIRTGRLDVTAGALSGGNQQKVLIAKTLAVEPDLIVFDEPTRGVDIGAKQQIYEIIATLAAEGKAIVVISSEMQEIVGLSGRVLVMRRGRIAGELSGDAISETDIIRFAMGLEDRAPQEEASH
jgi:ribose transport system ATP-binding protein